MPNPPRDRSRHRELAAEFAAKNNPTGWFEAFYRESAANATAIPWADHAPNPNLLNFWQTHPQNPAAGPALVIGCGLGDDAEQLAKWGFATTAFDISETAIRMARERFPHSPVNYVAANLLTPPPEWRAHFAFVFEAYTLQVLPDELRPTAAKSSADFVAPQGHLLVIARGRDASEEAPDLPWPLTREEFSAFTYAGLNELSFEDFIDDRETPPTRRFRAFYKRN
jgi:hypothetical protein